MQKLCNQLIINNLDSGKRFSNLGNDLQVVSATPYYYSIIPTASPTKPNGSVADVFVFCRFASLRAKRGNPDHQLVPWIASLCSQRREARVGAKPRIFES